MSTSAPEPAGAGRLRADACPGVVATHEAADGPLARIRLPGGALTPEQAVAVAACSDELGDGRIHLTSRANLQLRAVFDGDALVSRLATAGLLPSPAHERIRNILGSPLSGLGGGVADVRGLVRELDTALCSAADLTSLPGRFLFALDDGRGDVVADADLCWRAVSADTGALVVAGADSGLRVPRGGAVDALVTGARAFDAARGAAWRLREIDPRPVVEAVAAMKPVETVPAGDAMAEAGPAPRVGPVEETDGVVVAAPRLGELSAATMRDLGERGSALTVTPWRTVVVHDTSAAALSGRYSELVVDAGDPLLGVSACIGAPHCAKSHADVRGDAIAAAAAVGGTGLVAHFAGCSRRCGRPGGSHIDVVAAEGGYHVGGTFVGLDRVREELSTQAQATRTHQRTTREGQQ